MQGGYNRKRNMELAIKLQSPVFGTGETIKGFLNLKTKVNIEVDEVRVELLGYEIIKAPCFDPKKCPTPMIDLSTKIVDLKKRVRGSVKLVADQPEKIPFEILIPPTTPPTYIGKYAKTAFKLKALIYSKGELLAIDEAPIKLFDCETYGRLVSEQRT